MKTTQPSLKTWLRYSANTLDTLEDLIEALFDIASESDVVDVESRG